MFVIYPKTFESKIGFDRIRKMLSEGCLCELGREEVENMFFSTSYEAIKVDLQQTSELKMVLEFEENYPQDNYFDGRRSILKARIEGASPDVSDLVIIRKSLTVIIQLAKYFASDEKKVKFPELYKLSRQVELFPGVIKEINRIIDDNGKVKDNASPELQTIRSSLKQKQAEVNKKLLSILKQARQDGLVDDDVEITFRNDRPVIPVPASNKRKLGGMMHDESATGKTAFIEPAAVVELNNRVREYLMAEAREVKKILLAFADRLRPDIEVLVASYGFLAKMDFIRAKARFASRIKAILPIFHNEQSFSWKNAIHPLLYLTHSQEGKSVVPLTIGLSEENRILVISGPNAGGKSVCLKTTGLLQYMLQCGLLVPMSENSEAGVFSSIFIDIGDEQSIDNDLSTYSGHLENMKFFVKNAKATTLILIDEFGTGTEPKLGGAIAEAVLEKLHQQEIYGVITTHYANLKHYASETPGIANGAMLFDTQSIKPLYQLSLGKPGSSFAIDIARKIGLSEEILKNATEKIGEDHFNYDKQLREIARDKHYWQSKRQKIHKVEKTLDNLYVKYNGELDLVQKERKKILAEAKSEAEKILKGANASVERTIREIKEAGAEKEKTRLAREKLEREKQLFENIEEKPNRFLKKKKELQQAGKNLTQHSTELKESQVNQKKKIKPVVLQPGDLVRLQGMETPGEVIKIEGKHVTVAFGSMLSTVQINKIIRSENQTKPKESKRVKLSSDIMDRRLSFKPEIDVRGKRADEALDMVQRFIDEAIVASYSSLTILHGKGNGILRQMIQDYLSSLDLVKSCKDANVDRGGTGITEVELDY
jgi:DNA mismatch repair protein MutS2